MRWQNHIMTSVAISYVVSDNIFFGLIAGAGAIIPDAVEYDIRALKKHRGMSHNPIFWLIVCAAIYAGLKLSGVGDGLPYPKLAIELFKPFDPLSIIILGLSAGVFCHLLTDAMSTSGIPLWKRKKITLFKLYKTFRKSEIYTTYSILSICFIIKAIAHYY